KTLFATCYFVDHRLDGRISTLPPFAAADSLSSLRGRAGERRAIGSRDGPSPLVKTLFATALLGLLAMAFLWERNAWRDSERGTNRSAPKTWKPDKSLTRTATILPNSFWCSQQMRSVHCMSFPR